MTATGLAQRKACFKNVSLYFDHYLINAAAIVKCRTVCDATKRRVPAEQNSFAEEKTNLNCECTEIIKLTSMCATDSAKYNLADVLS